MKILTIHEWNKQNAAQEAWRSTWNDPHMAAGLATLKISACETGFHVPAGTDALTAGALRDAAREGFRCCIALIEQMGNPPPNGPMALPKAYELKVEQPSAEKP